MDEQAKGFHVNGIRDGSRIGTEQTYDFPQVVNEEKNGDGPNRATIFSPKSVSRKDIRMGKRSRKRSNSDVRKTQQSTNGGERVISNNGTNSVRRSICIRRVSGSPNITSPDKETVCNTGSEVPMDTKNLSRAGFWVTPVGTLHSTTSSNGGGSSRYRVLHVLDSGMHSGGGSKAGLSFLADIDSPETPTFQNVNRKQGGRNSSKDGQVQTQLPTPAFKIKLEYSPISDDKVESSRGENSSTDDDDLYSEPEWKNGIYYINSCFDIDGRQDNVEPQGLEKYRVIFLNFVSNDEKEKKWHFPNFLLCLVFFFLLGVMVTQSVLLV
jgi:hypothetical protein